MLDALDLKSVADEFVDASEYWLSVSIWKVQLAM